MWQSRPFSQPRQRGTVKALLRRTGLILMGVCLGACSTVDYYRQAATGHLHLLVNAKPIERVVADANTSAQLKQRLLTAMAVRQFATHTLALPDNASYTRYLDLGRPALLWNLVAAPSLSLKPKSWCFPVAGCVSYKGFFNPDLARQEADQLQQQGYEVMVYPVSAYSTLGWSNWLGGDPVLNTFVNRSEPHLARLIFHELAHQQVYVQDDSAFNEAFATAVEQLGGQIWMQAHASPEQKRQDALELERQRAFRTLTASTRQTLEKIYLAFADGRLTQEQAIAAKQAAMADMRQNYQSLKSHWQGYSGYDRWMNDANNASLVSQSTYEQWVPAFVQLFEQNQRDWPKFYSAVAALGQLSKPARQQALKSLAP